MPKTSNTLNEVSGIVNVADSIFNLFANLLADKRHPFTTTELNIFVPFSGQFYDSVKQDITTRFKINYVEDAVKYFPHIAWEHLCRYANNIDVARQERLLNPQPYYNIPDFQPNWTDSNFWQGDNQEQINIRNNWIQYFYGSVADISNYDNLNNTATGNTTSNKKIPPPSKTDISFAGLSAGQVVILIGIVAGIIYLAFTNR